MIAGLICRRASLVHTPWRRRQASGTGFAATREKKFDIQFLIDRFRRSLVSDSVCGFAEHISITLQRRFQFLGADRIAAAQHAPPHGR
jgi:hypothetical protein